MKKIISILVVFSFLFIANKALAVFLDFYYVCPVCSGERNSPCEKAQKECLLNKAKQEEQRKQLEQKQKENEAIEKEEKETIYIERKKDLSEYKNFFEEVGVSLNVDTTEEQYNQWKKELKEAKDEYLKEQENNQKIEDLENRIKELESKPTITEKIIISTETTKNKEEIIKPVVTENKPTKKEIVREEIKTETQKDNKEIQITQNFDTTKTTVTDTQKTSVFKRVFGWFKSLF